ncbi:tetratricopeptide repeat protein, partial [Thermodesulfobacteriota bacterium]
MNIRWYCLALLIITSLFFFSIVPSKAETPDAPDSLIQEANQAFQEDHYQEAIPLFQSAIAKAGNKLDSQSIAKLYLKLGFSLGEMGKYDEGLKMYEKAVEKGVKPIKFPKFKNKNSELHYNEGIKLERQKKHTQAINKYKEALEIEPN